MCGGGALPSFSKRRWPADGPVRELLSYLDQMHKAAGQPSLAEIGRAVALAPSTLSAFFTGARLIGRGNLELVVEHLGGEIELAESLRRKAATAWNTARESPADAGDVGEMSQQAIVDSARGGPAPVDASWDAPSRLDIVLYDSPVNKLNRPAELLGRESLMAEVDGLLDQGEQILLYGLGGGGKTAAAATIADRRVEAGAGPYLWLRTGFWDEAVIVDGIARRLGEGPDRERLAAASGDARLVVIGDIIARSGVRLCVFDDAWNPTALSAVLSALPTGVATIVTSRLKVGLRHAFEVGKLDPRWASRLLALHAQDDVLLSQPDAAALCQELGYHPFAIEIAGHHLRQYGLSPKELREHLGGAAHDLAMPNAFAAEGRDSVRRLLDQSYERLNDGDSQRVLAGFGALAAGSATIDLLALCVGLEARRARVALNRLVDVSLARRASSSLAYEIHDLTYAYARELWRSAPGDPNATIAAVRSFVSEHSTDYELLEADMENVLAAASDARSTDVDAFLAIVETIATGGYLDDHGHTLGFVRLLGSAIAAVRAQQPADLTRLHYLVTKRGNAYYNQGDLVLAVDDYREALELAPTPQRRAIMLGLLGKVLNDIGDLDDADIHFVEAYSVAEANDDDHSAMRVLEQHSHAAGRRQDFALARDLAQRGVTLSRRLEVRQIEATFLTNLGSAEFELGVQASIERHTEALGIAVEIDDEDVAALTHRALGDDYHAEQDYETAREHFLEALRLYQKLGQIDRATQLRTLMTRFGYLT
jgi:tetratricopeptide (TPR) repeat protein